MEAAGIGLAVVAEVRTLVNSVLVRITAYRRGPDAFRILTKSLNDLAENGEEVNRLIRKFPHALPNDASVLFNRYFAQVRASLQGMNDIMENNFSRTFTGGNIGLLGNLMCKIYRTVRAKKISETMNVLEIQIKETSSQLLQLTVMLTTALNIREQEERIVPKLDNLNPGDSMRHVYHAAITAPAVPHTVNLNFEANADGVFETPEGTLKHEVLSSSSSATVTAATGALSPACGVVGMAGVGKTIAIQGLAADEDIQTRFPDGVHFMTLGQGATSESAIREVRKIMKATGATASIAAEECSDSLRDVVDDAVAWFNGKSCLFLVDDLWPTESCVTGYLNELRQLLRGSPRKPDGNYYSQRYCRA